MKKCLAVLLLACAHPDVLAGSSATHSNDDTHSDAHHAGDIEEITVQATRSRRRIQDEPIRVEVLSQEEIEEKLLMRPGNISMMLNETGGIRVQVTSPALGSANVRIHGMRGRYTQLPADGLPLYGGQAASLGLLQVPPSDLGQVEVIKGSSSALYGGQSLGGVNGTHRCPVFGEIRCPLFGVLVKIIWVANPSLRPAPPVLQSWAGSADRLCVSL